MVRVQPFHAIRPVRGSEQRIASPPYDVVSDAEARKIAEANPDSFIRVVRSEVDGPPDADPYSPAVYEGAAANFNRLIRDGLLSRETEPRMFVYRQAWRHHTQAGIVCCCHVDDYERDLIRKHEKTRQVKEDDRTRHVLTVNANTGPVFLTYRDVHTLSEMMARDMNARPLFHFTTGEGVTHTVWPIDRYDEYVGAFADISHVYIADGHHRAASAARAAKTRREANSDHKGTEEYNWFLAALFPASQLTILAYNRVVRDLQGMSATKLMSALSEVGSLSKTDAAAPSRPGTVHLYVGGEWHQLVFPPETIDRADPINSLDVALLQDRVLSPVFGIADPRADDRLDFVGGIRGTEHLEQLVDSGEAGIAFSLYPTSIEQLMQVSDAGLIMPPKSTWFEPKLRSGLLIHSLD